MEYRRWIDLVRDLVSMGAGVYILVNSQMTGNVHTELLFVALVLLGSPAGIALARIFRGNGDGGNGSKDSSSDSQSSGSSSPRR